MSSSVTFDQIAVWAAMMALPTGVISLIASLLSRYFLITAIVMSGLLFVAATASAIAITTTTIKYGPKDQLYNAGLRSVVLFVLALAFCALFIICAVRKPQKSDQSSDDEIGSIQDTANGTAVLTFLTLAATLAPAAIVLVSGLVFL